MREVTLGQHKLAVFEQSIPYLERRVFPKLQVLLGGLAEQQGEASLDGFIQGLGAKAYEVLGLFIPVLPKVVPEWEWRGYASQAAMEAGEDSDEAIMAAPTHPQLVAAFKAIIAENELELYGKLGALIDPKLIRAFLNDQLATQMGRLGGVSSSSPSPSGDTALPRPSGTDPTPSGSTDSPGPE